MHLIIKTPRLYLRRFTLADAPLIYELNSKPEVLQYVHEHVIKDNTHATEVLTNIIMPQYQRNLGRWATFISHTHEFIGWCGLKFRTELDETDIGYRFLPQYWGKGYATEAAKHTLEYGLDTVGLQTITGRAHVENAASLKVLQKIGMTYLKDEVVDNCPVKTFVISR